MYQILFMNITKHDIVIKTKSKNTPKIKLAEQYYRDKYHVVETGILEDIFRIIYLK